ncbi:MAG: tRNA (N6-isopentenyl adenosine(37)-C2)-methylthiotransferase MiaB [Candidatus Omnitrophica bacterium]|nr:tRNA (N6-isopentenyl adenosine(37)-C2)-methylthiotransferase MiaB [Candidatus Omnitrophota bacterium]
MLKVFLKTYGCQMNDRDSELVMGLLLQHGYTPAQSAAEADVILFNTCAVRQKAEDKVWSEIGRMKQWKYPKGENKRNAASHSAAEGEKRLSGVQRKIIGIIGCMAEHYGEKAFLKAPVLDLVVGPNNITDLPLLLERVAAELGPQHATGKAKREDSIYAVEYGGVEGHANVIIMEGCDNFCAYCIVPHVRGRERSRAADDIIREIKGLAAAGIRQVTLLGQNVNSYRGTRNEGRETKDDGRKTKDEGRIVNFVDLLRAVNDIAGLEVFDFVTSHPKDASPVLFKAMAELPKCRKFLHLPVQAGSNRILQMMNRGYTREQFMELARQAREVMPQLRLTTDVMVGFPTETDEDFQDTLDLFRQVKFDAAYIFKYSVRPGTQAASLPDDVPDDVKKQRNEILLRFQQGLHREKKRTR